jgi:hypothetical protein
VVRFLPFLISLVLSVYALFSCIQTRDEDVPYLPKLAWVVLIVFVPFVGPIVWLLVSRTTGTAQRERPARPARTPSRQVAPDDDPDFLASLERYRDPRTTVRPPTPGAAPEPEDKPGAAADEPQAKDETAGDKAARDKAAGDRAKDNAAKDKKAKDKKPRDTESGAPTESDDGKP